MHNIPLRQRYNEPSFLLSRGWYNLVSKFKVSEAALHILENRLLNVLHDVFHYRLTTDLGLLLRIFLKTKNSTTLYPSRKSN